MDAKKGAAAPRREFRHPALQLLGISRLRVPSRNWLVFYGVTGALLGAYYYDREQRRQIRARHVAAVEPLGRRALAPGEQLRRVRVYLAPPPNDVLEPSLQQFRNYIKPVLTAAAVDHELVTEERQGFIRSRVAEDVRRLRRGEAPAHTEGALIVGRGAYKEYLSGLQEGLLGPLDPPAEVVEQIAAEARAEEERLQRRRDANAKSTDGTDQSAYDTEADYEEDRRARLFRQYPVVPPYIALEDLAAAPLAPAVQQTPQDPIAVFREPHLLGILMAPVRIWRWLHERTLAEELGRQAVAVVQEKKRPFELRDVDLAIEDEEDWPAKFKQKGLEAGSEWMHALVVDPRIAELLEVYEP